MFEICNGVAGELVPIPTFPDESILILSVPLEAPAVEPELKVREPATFIKA